MSIHVEHQVLEQHNVTITSDKFVDNDIEKFIEIIASCKPNIILLPNNKCGPKGAVVIANILIDPNYHLIELDISYNRYIGIDGLNLIADAIAQNKSLITFKFENFTGYDELDEFTKRLAVSIKFHPCLKYLDLSFNRTDYISDVIQCLPKKLTHLVLWGNFLDIDDITCLQKNTHLRSLSIWFRNDNVFEKTFHNKKMGILANKMLIDFCCFKFGYWSNHTNQIRIDEMLNPNRNARDAASKAALCLIAIRIFRRNECGLLGHIDKNVVVTIAKYVFESYGDDVWRIRRSNRLRVKRLKH